MSIYDMVNDDLAALENDRFSGCRDAIYQNADGHQKSVKLWFHHDFNRISSFSDGESDVKAATVLIRRTHAPFIALEEMFLVASDENAQEYDTWVIKDIQSKNSAFIELRCVYSVRKRLVTENEKRDRSHGVLSGGR